MPKRRTRKQKEIAQERQLLEYTLVDEEKMESGFASKPATKTVAKSKVFTAYDLFDYDTHLITKDLYKTLMVSLVILGLQMVIYYFVR